MNLYVPLEFSLVSQLFRVFKKGTHRTRENARPSSASKGADERGPETAQREWRQSNLSRRQNRSASRGTTQG